ncbi:MAG: twin-arginine translocase subunit TatB [Gammaproteobacteria bacterium]|jgi:sec-independent protein translocase protein TatB|nr:twin-arginine translocase subunit TatB [Gammaproteobacteria bacterium]MBT4245580.1 twin-arginine translocase subunit TatB [Gammaproteobacteria bacterium]MBT4587070.1 twin-arginine translocase subunit TatB [Gammaproteobacteria bacterium]MBT5978478.1 twin-arginine translocase subunit TatB [Gammaproteobacteria bacterium]MBT7390539.1 twin-arginine translocase subunit TatB [Gammaproteobacteria bacterium]
MFDFGFWEIAIIGVITLIVVGPERLPALARKAGVIMGKLNKFLNKVKADINEELKTDELKEHLSMDDEKSIISDISNEAKSSVDLFNQNDAQQDDSKL